VKAHVIPSFRKPRDGRPRDARRAAGDECHARPRVRTRSSRVLRPTSRPRCPSEARMPRRPESSEPLQKAPSAVTRCDRAQRRPDPCPRDRAAAGAIRRRVSSLGTPVDVSAPCPAPCPRADRVDADCRLGPASTASVWTSDVRAPASRTEYAPIAVSRHTPASEEITSSSRLPTRGCKGRPRPRRGRPMKFVSRIASQSWSDGLREGASWRTPALRTRRVDPRSRPRRCHDDEAERLRRDLGHRCTNVACPHSRHRGRGRITPVKTTAAALGTQAARRWRRRCRVPPVTGTERRFRAATCASSHGRRKCGHAQNSPKS
jgi:hypothetical protein